jgi:hypothetical protein
MAKWTATTDEQTRACRHCGKQPHHRISRDDPQVMEWHDIACRNKKCEVKPNELAMSKEVALEKWNKRMGCSDCKLADQLILTLNARLDACNGHTGFTRGKVENHRWRT